MSTVRLGYAIPTGDPVDIPVRHLCITGQTQEAGKTTALESLITRAELRAVTFVTKRGEASFRQARRIPPYFRERADWQFVASILEASRGERLKFERAWIIRASKGARTLADVHANVRRALHAAKGLSADVYLTLDAYLDAVVPTIGRVRWAPAVDLHAGVNCMDLTDVPVEMQHLVLQSTIQWVLDHAQGTVVVIPEAWKFLPQGRGTPVKLAAEAFIRQAAACWNYLWLDSQDIGGIEKTILRSVPVWLLGVQREANEIKRTLLNIPAGTAKPLPADLATLELGQFYACWGRHVVKTYAIPLWIDHRYAVEVARGLAPVMVGGKALVGSHVVTEVAWTGMVRPAGVQLAEPEAPADAQWPDGDIDYQPRMLGDDTMTPAQEQKLDQLIETVDRLAGAIGQQVMAQMRQAVARSDEPRMTEGSVGGEVPYGVQPLVARDDGTMTPVTASTLAQFLALNMETIYQALKHRLLADLPRDPAILQILTQQPELVVTVERKIIEADGTSPDGWIGRLIADGFFDDTRAGNAAFEELKRRGASLAKPTAYLWCDNLVKRGFLSKEKDGYRAVPGMKVQIRTRS